MKKMCALTRILHRNLWTIFKQNRLFCASTSLNVDFSHQVDEPELEELKAKLDENGRALLKKYMNEYEVYKFADSKMPSSVSPKQWERILRMDETLERIRYFTHLYNIEVTQKKVEAKKERQCEEYERKLRERREDIQRKSEEHIYYGIGGNAIFRRILDVDMNRHLKARFARAMTFGPHLIFDMGFFPIMRQIESSLTAVQFLQMHHDNRGHAQPHHFIFVNCHTEHHSWKDVENFMNTSASLYTVTEKSYLDLFPREQLIYLSPDAKIAFDEYEADKVYIVGACVDKPPRPNVTLAKAKEEGIETRRFPIEKCVRLVGSKSLCLNHVVNIMNDSHTQGSITNAIFNNLPKRKIVPKTSEAAKQKRARDKERLSYLWSLANQSDN